MNPSESAAQIQQSLEATSGKPVLIQSDSSIPGHASIKIATKDAPAHVLRYKPDFEPELPYLIAFQCGLALRSVQTSNHCRFDLASKPAMGPEVHQMIEDHLRSQASGIPLTLAPQLASQLGHGLGLQLRSMPIAIRVDAWLLREYPALSELQRTNVERQLQEAMQALSPSVRAFAPKPIIDANASMSCAFAQFWSQAWGEPQVVAPFLAAGYGTIGGNLLHLVESMDPSPDGDRALIEAWAQALGLDRWFETIDAS